MKARCRRVSGFYSHEKSHDMLSAFCPRPAPYHLAPTSRNGSLHQQLSAPFSLSACLLKTVLITSAPPSLLPFPSLNVILLHSFYADRLDSLFLLSPVWHNFHPLSSSSTLSCPDRKKATLAGESFHATASIKARLTTEI